MSSGWVPFLLYLFPVACGVDDDGRPLFLFFSAVALSPKSFVLPPMLSRYSLSASVAFSLRGPGQCRSNDTQTRPLLHQMLFWFPRPI